MLVVKLVRLDDRRFEEEIACLSEEVAAEPIIR